VELCSGDPLVLSCCLPCLCCVGVVCAGVALSVGRLSSSAGIAAMVGLIDCMCLRIVVYCNCFCRSYRSSCIMLLVPLVPLISVADTTSDR